MSEISKTQIYAVYAVRLAQKTVRYITLGRIKPMWSIRLIASYSERNRRQSNKLQKSQKTKKVLTEPPSTPVYRGMSNTFCRRPGRRKRTAARFTISDTCASVAQR